LSEHKTSDSALALAEQPFASVVLECESVEVSDDDMTVLVFIAGYVGRKAKLASNCDACINELVSRDMTACDINNDHLVYTSALDRSGLTWPNQWTLS